MLTIRNQQKAALAAARRQDFAARVLSQIAAVFPERHAVTPEAELRQLIEHGIAAAARHGVTGQRDVALWIQLMVGLAPDFEQRPEFAWTRAILDDPGLDGTGKIARLYAELDGRLAAAEG
jgi:hypothetical protein